MSQNMSTVRRSWSSRLLNPFRPQKRRAGDYVMVAAAFIVCAALVIWAIKG